MTVDRFVEDRRARWARLGNLIFEANGRVERLAPDDVLELGRLYRSASSDLAVARRDFALDAATERLNDLVAAAHALVYSEAPTSGRRLRGLVLRDLPATVRANSRYTAVSLAAFAIPLIATFTIGLL
ncbi:MAG: stage II sporulation protein M, partial [Chloroflexota bacterium]|nr:stage II sporulation protein M [Chloroflexota bacterium]